MVTIGIMALSGCVGVTVYVITFLVLRESFGA